VWSVLSGPGVGGKDQVSPGCAGEMKRTCDVRFASAGGRERHGVKGDTVVAQQATHEETSEEPS
jgi:hypothetical protein